MARRGFGVGTIRPELREDAGIIAALGDVRGVGKTGDGVAGVAVSVIEIEVAGTVVAA